MKLKPKELRKSSPSNKQISKIKRNPIYLILDEVIDTYNIGSLFRLADAVGVEKMYFCGNMEYPPSSRIHKAAVGTEAWVPWEKADSTLELILKLKSQQSIAPSVTLGQNTIGIRYPRHWFGEVITEIGIPIVTTSANKHGQPFMTSLENLNPEIERGVEFMIYEGEKSGKPSKIIDTVHGEIKER